MGRAQNIPPSLLNCPNLLPLDEFIPGCACAVLKMSLFDAGVMNLYERVERMAKLQPMFVDITWGAGGSTTDLTLELRSRKLPQPRRARAQTLHLVSWFPIQLATPA